jgi:hypothetical protein
MPSPFASSSVAAHQIIQKLAFTERFERSPRFVALSRARRRRRRRRLHDRGAPSPRRPRVLIPSLRASVAFERRFRASRASM